MRRFCASIAALAAALALAGPAAAVEPTGDRPNDCPHPGGQGAPCPHGDECDGNAYATVCVQHRAGDPATRRCEIPCQTGEAAALAAEPAACAIGETCLEGKAAGDGRAFYCKATRFRVDLNLLDQCVVHHLRGTEPVFSANRCSLEANLTSLLDQNGDFEFDIFDLDLCVLAFLEQPGCRRDPVSGAWDCGRELDLVPCEADDDCGTGLYCAAGRHVCQRDCGVIASREEALSSLDRECTGALKACRRDRGRCEPVDPTAATCQVDDDCVAGAYCFLGRCAPRCYRSLDCPTSDWYCALNNVCRPKPHPAADGTFEFVPENYAIRFLRDGLNLDAVQVFDRSGLAVMDIITKRRVVGNPSVSFGYQLEVSYDLKQDVQCLVPFVDCTDDDQRPAGESEADCLARQDDCYVDPTVESWIRLVSPFGTVSAIGDPGVEVELDEAIAEALTPGIYTATLLAIYDNGDSDTIPLRYTKRSPSGRYDGTLTVYMHRVENALNGNRPLQFALRLSVTDRVTRWNELLRAHNIEVEEDIEDLTRGYEVHALLDGSSALAFTRGDAASTSGDEIPFVGLYSPDLGRMRLIGLIDIPADLCIAGDGACDELDDEQLQVRNLFGRAIRRQIEFIGPFDEGIGRFHGIYRENISGLAADFDLTLEGGFIMDQVLVDGSPIPLDGPLLDDVMVGDPPVAPDPPPVRFPADDEVLAQIEDEIAARCAASDAEVEHLAGLLDGFLRIVSRPDHRQTLIDLGVPPELATPDLDGLLAYNDVDGQQVDVGGGAWARVVFSSPERFAWYLAAARRRGAATSYSVLGRTTIFPELLEFNSALEFALGALGDDPRAQQDHLNIYDFVSSRILPCDPEDPAPPTACIDEDAVRCGLALHQKAYLLGWFNPDEVEGAGETAVTGELELFCPDTIRLDGCPPHASHGEALFAMQEHGRFWSNLGQILKFDGDRARSDAFLVQFRNEVNLFVAGAALGLDHRFGQLLMGRSS